MTNFGAILTAFWQVVTDPLRRLRGFDTRMPGGKTMPKLTRINDHHWLEYAEGRPIPGGDPMLVRRFLVIHFTAGASAESSIAWWRQLGNGVCAHLVIDRDGTVYQCRPFNRTCGHAGRSSWVDPKTGKIHRNLNQCSIGIELANGGSTFPTRFSTLPPVRAIHKHGGSMLDWERYPKKQLDACFVAARSLVDRYNLDDVVGHEDVAPDRKTDPGPAFPMGALREFCGFPSDFGSTSTLNES